MTDDRLLAELERHFGFDAFHAGQRPVIEDVLAGRPTVAVMPTGAGKSLCYQLPALLLPGLTVVVSPLIALMKDQVDGLRAKGISADFVNSSQSREEQRAVFDRIGTGETRLVYVAPERFRSGAFLRALEDVPLELFAVDEAHCISRWGHDFRPDYVRLGNAIRRLRPPRILACTATATPDVQEDIHKVLGLEHPSVHIAGFLRSNLFLEARLCSGDKDRERRLAAFLKSERVQGGSVIVYASTRKRVERYAEACFAAIGRHAVVAYHGGMEDGAREQAQERFMSGEAQVAVATNAFGMGVDRSDVRAVVHIDLPRTVEGYYQEVGRAGRDGDPAHCLLLYNPNDTRVHEFLIGQNHPKPATLEAVWEALQKAPGTVYELTARLRQIDSDAEVEAALRELGRVDAVRWEHRSAWPTPGAPPDVNHLGIDFERMALHRAHELDKLRRMKRYVHQAGCRHAYVLDYFGDEMSAECPGCDRCHGGVEGGIPGVVLEPPTEEEALLLRKALAGVARAEGRFGLKKVAGMLAGSKSKEVGRTSLVRLSTYGLLKELGSDRCAELLQLLVDQDLCRVAGRQYPLLEISEIGWQVMQQEREADFRPPPNLVPGSPTFSRVSALKGERPRRKRRAPVRSEDCLLDERIIDALRDFRTAEAGRRIVPPYCVFSNRTLEAIAEAVPADEASFLAVQGLGPGKWAQFGPALIETLGPYR